MTYKETCNAILVGALLIMMTAVVCFSVGTSVEIVATHGPIRAGW